MRDIAGLLTLVGGLLTVSTPLLDEGVMPGSAAKYQMTSIYLAVTLRFFFSL